MSLKEQEDSHLKAEGGEFTEDVTSIRMPTSDDIIPPKRSRKLTSKGQAYELVTVQKKLDKLYLNINRQESLVITLVKSSNVEMMQQELSKLDKLLIEVSELYDRLMPLLSNDDQKEQEDKHRAVDDRVYNTKVLVGNRMIEIESALSIKSASSRSFSRRSSYSKPRNIATGKVENIVTEDDKSIRDQPSERMEPNKENVEDGQDSHYIAIRKRLATLYERISRQEALVKTFMTSRNPNMVIQETANLDRLQAEAEDLNCILSHVLTDEEQSTQQQKHEIVESSVFQTKKCVCDWMAQYDAISYSKSKSRKSSISKGSTSSVKSKSSSARSENKAKLAGLILEEATLENTQAAERKELEAKLEVQRLRIQQKINKAKLINKVLEEEEKGNNICIAHTNEPEMNATNHNSDLKLGIGIEGHSIVSQLCKTISKLSDCQIVKVKTMDLKMEPMKLPSFDGKIREYIMFKSDFESHVRPSVKSDISAAYVLKSCLKGEPLDIVKSMNDDISEIWTRLDEKYGRVSKLIDVIMLEIKQLRRINDGEEKQFLELVNIVEQCYRDLSRINMETEITNSTIIGLIEEKLPRYIKRMWCLEVDNHEAGKSKINKFTCLLEFLKKHRRAIEYEASDIRSNRKGGGGWPVNHVDGGSHPVCLIHPTGQHQITDCRVFLLKTAADRSKYAKEKNLCWSCLQPGHTISKCARQEKCNKDGCNKSHHPSVHIDKEAHEDSHHLLTSVNNLSGSKSCILPIMKVNGGKNLQQNINIMWDSGSTISMITFKKAKEMQLTGVKAQLSIVKVGGKKDEIESKYYEVPIRDIHGQLVKFNAYGISKISSAINQIDTHLIQEAMPGECLDQLQPTGDVDMLIGFDYAGFHPEKEKAAGHLILLKNRFGRCISGSYKGADGSTTKIVQTAQVSHVCQVPRLVDFYECESLGIHSQPIQPNVVAHLSGEAKIEDFYSNESLGVSCQPQCGSCRCGECPIGGKQYTIKEEQELLLIDKNLKLTNGVWTVTYPWIKPPEELPDNYPLAFAMLKSTEAKLRKNLQLAKTYDEQIRDMVSRGAARKLSTDELQSYVGPKFYIGHHEILKPESLSTPCRIVFNSSAKFGSHILNDYWAKGPDMMNNLLGVLIRFREDNVAIAGDLKKMYHSVKLSPIDQQTHRFLWRDMQLDRKPDIYVMTAVSFGDKPAGAIATLALRKTAENNAEKFPNAAKIIIKNSYVDDIIDSLSSHEEAKRATNEIEIALNTGGFEIKNWTVSNSDAGTVDISHGTEGQSEDVKVLGIVWRPTTDVLQFKASINFSEKVRKIHLQPNLSASDVPDKVPNELTKRMILSQVNRIYDPLGLAAPFTVKAKILLRKLCQYKLNWDDPIPMNERAEWVTFFRELFEMNFVEFVRATKPINATGEPVLIIFCDASKEAFGACAYIRWRTTDGKFVSTLLVAKSRLSPLRELTIVRLELNSGLMGARLKKFITIESRLTFQKIYMITDSEIVRAMIMKESYGFKTFVSLRVGEIQQLTQRGDWYWIEGSLNIADIITRGKEPSSLRIHSDWQNGPSFLKDEETLWPLRQSFSGTIIPEQIIMAIKVTESSVCMSNIIEACRFSYSKLLRITARIISAFKQNPKPSLKNIKCLPIPEEIREAERMWIKDAQEQITETVKPHTLERLGAANKDGVMVVGTKLESWGPLGNDYPALLPGNCILAKLYALEEHNRCHLGISAEAAKIQAKYWIIGLRRLLRSIRYNCVTCRKTDKKVQEQLMGQIPLDRLTPAPAWHYTSLAIFGPFEVKGEVNKRSRGKAYGVIFNF